MKSLLSSSDLKQSTTKSILWDQLKRITEAEEGYIYYKYPITGMADSYIPCFAIIDYNNGIFLFEVIEVTIDSLEILNDGATWKVNNTIIESPLFKLEDYKIRLENIIRNYRQIRGKILVRDYMVFPAINKTEFINKYNSVSIDSLIFGNFDVIEYKSLFKNSLGLREEEKKVYISVIQGAGPLIGNISSVSAEKAGTMGAAIKLLDKKMAILDAKQHEAAVQIPDGPQRIRGMAGTGKTVILCMKAAYLHGRYPEAKILYTFHTQSLYNQVQYLIAKFYHEQNNSSPDWDKLLVLHSWGGRSKEGVYYRTCQRNSIIPMNFKNVPYSTDEPLDYVCSSILAENISEEFDYVLMDESQDFPPSFFQLVYKITKDPKRIIFAYDELQTLANTKIQDVKELFGYDNQGKPLVDFGVSSFYADEIEKDIILEKSYRNPYQLLMVAHGLGMGLYNTDGIMQIIDNEKIWNSIGYEIENGTLKPDTQVTIKRPSENTISLVHECYNGAQQPISYLKCDSFVDEINWIADSISNDCKKEDVEPHNIVVISLNKDSYKREFPLLQKQLFALGVPSIIPGYEGVERDKFGEKGFVTLSTVFKAKGNEAFIIYVMSVEYIYHYLEFVHARNSVFTALTRTKGWCRITGCGDLMDRAIIEIKSILENLPRFIFTYPDPEKIARKLSQEEYARRIAETKKTKNSIEQLLSADPEALKTIPKEHLAELLKRLKSNAD
ncbi:MAG: ATP-binding domain-containing protein [Tannerella sp.]|jgi:superfamily I DNA and RNA helicase|nr:ATP-binding domain-containing protein [Tannerella sp.]